MGNLIICPNLLCTLMICPVLYYLQWVLVLLCLHWEKNSDGTLYSLTALRISHFVCVSSVVIDQHLWTTSVRHWGFSSERRHPWSTSSWQMTPRYSSSPMPASFLGAVHKTFCALPFWPFEHAQISCKWWNTLNIYMNHFPIPKLTLDSYDLQSFCREAMIPCILLALGGNLVDG